MEGNNSAKLQDGHASAAIQQSCLSLRSFIRFSSFLAWRPWGGLCLPHKLTLQRDTSLKLRIPNPGIIYTNMTPTTASPQNDQTSQKSRHTETCVRIIFFTSLENEEQLGCSKIDLWLWHPKNRGSKKLPSHQEMSSANCLNTTVTCFTLFPKDYFHILSHYFHPHAMFYSLLDCSPSDIGGRLGSSLLHDGVGPSPPPANAWSTPLPVIAGTKFPPFDLKVQCHKEKNSMRMGWLLMTHGMHGVQQQRTLIMNNIPHPCSWMFMVFKTRT